MTDQHKEIVKVLDKIAQALFAISDSLDRVAEATNDKA
jgi:hypothetical protein